MAEITTEAPPAPVAAASSTTAPEVSTAPTVTPAPDENQAIAELDNLTPEQLDALLEQTGTHVDQSGKVIAKPADTKATKEATPPTTPPKAEVTTPEQPKGENNEEDDTDPTKPPPKNFRFHTEDPQRARFLRMLRQNPEADPVAIALAAGYKGPVTAAPTEAPVATTPPTQTDDQLVAEMTKSTRDKIAELEATIKDKKSRYEDRDEEIAQLAQHRMKLQSEESEAREQIVYEREHAAQRQAHTAEAIRLCPATGQKGTPQWRAVKAEVLLAESEGDAILDQPDYPVAILKRAAANRPDLFPELVSKPSTQPTKQPTPAPPARLAKGNVEAPVASAQTALTTEAAIEEIDKIDSLEALEAAADMAATGRRR